MRNLAAQESNAVVVRGQTSSLQPSLVQDGWSQHKSKILRLYMEENRSLNEVMDIMEKEDGFTATRKAYKYRFLKIWACRKNIKLQDVDNEAIVTMGGGGGGGGGPTGGPPSARRGEVRLANGQVVEMMRLYEHVRRRERRRQRNDASITWLRPPDTLHGSEAAVSGMRLYSEGYYEALFLGPEPGEAARRFDPFLRKFNNFTYAVNAALEQDELDVAVGVLKRAPDELATTMQRLPINFPCNILILVSCLAQPRNRARVAGMRNQLFGVVRSLLRYAATTSANLGLPRPIQQLFHGLAMLEDAETLYHMSVMVWTAGTHVASALLSKEPRSSFRPSIGNWINCFDIGGFADEDPDVQQVIRQERRQIASKYNAGFDLYTSALWDCALLQMGNEETASSGRYERRPLDTNPEEYNICRSILQGEPRGTANINALLYTAEHHKSRGDWAQAYQNMLDAIHALREDWGEDDPIVLTHVSELQSWLAEWGVHCTGGSTPESLELGWKADLVMPGSKDSGSYTVSGARD